MGIDAGLVRVGQKNFLMFQGATRFYVQCGFRPDVSGQPIGPIFKGQEAQFLLGVLDP